MLLLFNPILIMHRQPAFLTSAKKRKKKKKNKSKQVTKNTCIRYCLQLDKMIHISKNEFETLKLPVKDRFSQSINSTISKCFTKTSPNYLNEVFELACPNKSRTRNACLIIGLPFTQN